jgi:hypothetical protein
MADDEEALSDFFFRCDLKSFSPLTGSFSDLSLAELGPPGGVTSVPRPAELDPPGGVISLLRLAGSPLASHQVLIEVSGSEPKAAIKAGAIKRILAIPVSKL